MRLSPQESELSAYPERPVKRLGVSETHNVFDFNRWWRDFIFVTCLFFQMLIPIYSYAQQFLPCCSNLWCIPRRNLLTLASEAASVHQPVHNTSQFLPKQLQYSLELILQQVIMLPLPLYGWIWVCPFESLASKNGTPPLSSCIFQASCLSKLLHCSGGKSNSCQLVNKDHIVLATLVHTSHLEFLITHLTKFSLKVLQQQLHPRINMSRTLFKTINTRRQLQTRALRVISSILSDRDDLVPSLMTG